MEHSLVQVFLEKDNSTEQLLWTNVCSLVKVLIIKKEENVFHPGFDKDILALALNMCQILIQKCNLDIVRNNTDEETAKLYKLYLTTGSSLEEINQVAFNQAVSIRKVQFDIQGAVKPRQ